MADFWEEIIIGRNGSVRNKKIMSEISKMTEAILGMASLGFAPIMIIGMDADSTAFAATTFVGNMTTCAALASMLTDRIDSDVTPIQLIEFLTGKQSDANEQGSEPCNITAYCPECESPVETGGHSDLVMAARGLAAFYFDCPTCNKRYEVTYKIMMIDEIDKGGKNAG